MGHKVTKDVSKRYNHRDKQGQKRLLAKAREVFKILDKTLFKDRLTERAGRPTINSKEGEDYGQI
jgi:hypothetical protein